MKALALLLALATVPRALACGFTYTHSGGLAPHSHGRRLHQARLSLAQQPVRCPLACGHAHVPTRAALWRWRAAISIIMVLRTGV